ncbi:ParA family protein [Sedimentisphaera cyanobacteriorum]|nr:AAA family ATPase [Sedimentisphaera cyanobacteriorum]
MRYINATGKTKKARQLMRTISILNQKGGVGKTTTSANVAACLAEIGKKTLVVDMDPQAHLTLHFGIDPNDIEFSLYELLTGSCTLEDAAEEIRDNLSILPANIDLVGAENEIWQAEDREQILRHGLGSSELEFDYVIIDCPPSLGLLSLNALAASDEVIIPLQPHFLALQGLSKLLETVEIVSSRINPELKVLGVLLCMFDTRTSLSKEVKNDIAEFLEASRNSGHPWQNAKVIPTAVRNNIKLAEAPGYGKTIYEYEPNCNGAIDYRMVTGFITGEYIDFETDMI